MADTPVLQLELWDAGILQPDLVHNDNIRLIDILLGQQVASRTTTAQPGSPAAGDTYILAATHTGADWGALAEHDLVWYDGAAWQVWTPGARGRPSFWVDDDDQRVQWDGTNWIAIAEVLP